MIDDLTELGNYDFQIRLINSDKTSRGTLPPVFAGIIIKAPVCEEEGVNYSVVNYSKAATGETLDVFDENGDYIKTTWISGDIITDSRLNKIEDALYEINNDEVDLSGYATKEHTHTGYLTTVPSEYITETELNSKGYATETFVTNKIAEAQLDGGDVDLSGYATKTYVDDMLGDIETLLGGI